IKLMDFIEQPYEQYKIQKFQKQYASDLVSSKTQTFNQIKIQIISQIKIDQIKYSNFGILLQTDFYENIYFLHEIFHDFANNDDGLPECIIFSDFKHFCRLSFITENPQNEPDIDFFTLSDKQVANFFHSYATQVWKYGNLGLNMQDFSKTLQQICNVIYTETKD
ncbi:hypothetical protein IMG5_127220, partial [Ichthyophthirius multifiliis]